MGRLIEIPDASGVPPALTVNVGDLLLFAASGGRVRSGAEFVHMLGPFSPSVVGDNGQIFSPAGGPNAVLFLARRAGAATIDVVIGDPWRESRTVTRNIVVEP